MFNRSSSRQGAENAGQNSVGKGSEAKVATTPRALKALWATQTKASVLTESEFIVRKAHDDLFVAGVTGFIDEWAKGTLKGDLILREKARSAETRLENDLRELRDIHGDRLVVATHGVRRGMPEMAQEICKRLQIPLVGVTSVQSFGRRGPPADTIVVAGEGIADESAPLVRLSDRLLVMGGGDIAKKEALLFANSGPDAWRNLFLYKNYGGSAGDLSGTHIHATFVMS